MKKKKLLPPEYKKLNNIAFSNELALQSYLANHAKEFCKDILGDDLISFEVNKTLDSDEQLRMSPRGRRVDLLIKGRNKLYIVELKNPFTPADNRAGIGQLLDYGREFLDPKKELVLLTTYFDIHTAKTIEYYNLPIRYIYFELNRSLEYKGEEEKR